IQCTSAKSNLIKPLIVKKRTDLDISSIKIPTTKHRGKPKGALQTVIGLKKKRKILTKKPFKFLHYNERNKLILSWFCSIDVVNKALSSNFKINDTNLNEYNSIPNNIIDELVDLFQVKQFFSPSAWAKVQKIVAQKNVCHSLWQCPLCQKKCANNSISCDYCLTWYHPKCVNLISIPKKNCK
ncbi:protein FAR-RED IMPAIRED RESPONSE 1-like, partial [Aphis craccivora]